MGHTLETRGLNRHRTWSSSVAILVQSSSTQSSVGQSPPSPCRRRHHPGTQKQPLFIRCLLFSEAVSGCRSHLGRLLRRRFFFGLGAVIQLFRRLAMFDAANTEIWTELSRRVARKRSRSFLSDSNGRDRLCRCVTTSRQLNRIACHPVSSASVYFRFQ